VSTPPPVIVPDAPAPKLSVSSLGNTRVDNVVSAVSSVATVELGKLGVQIDAQEINAVLGAAIDALCMRALRQAEAAGQAAADSIATAAQAEAELRRR